MEHTAPQVLCQANPPSIGKNNGAIANELACHKTNNSKGTWEFLPLTADIGTVRNGEDCLLCVLRMWEFSPGLGYARLADPFSSGLSFSFLTASAILKTLVTNNGVLLSYRLCLFHTQIIPFYLANTLALRLFLLELQVPCMVQLRMLRVGSDNSYHYTLPSRL